MIKIAQKMLAQGTGLSDKYLPAGPYGLATTQPSSIVAWIFQVIINLSAVIFLIMLLIGGFTYLISAGNEEGTAKAKKTMLNAIIGLIIVLAVWGVGTTLLRIFGFRV